jgi:hypothetical protein
MQQDAAAEPTTPASARSVGSPALGDSVDAGHPNSDGGSADAGAGAPAPAPALPPAPHVGVVHLTLNGVQLDSGVNPALGAFIAFRIGPHWGRSKGFTPELTRDKGGSDLLEGVADLGWEVRGRAPGCVRLRRHVCVCVCVCVYRLVHVPGGGCLLRGVSSVCAMH